MSAVFGLVIDY